MDTKSSKAIALVALMTLVPFLGNAQTTTFNHDKSKYQVIRSTEDGTWGFTPGLYFYITHKNYSGAYFRGFKVKFKESKSNVKRVSVPRMAQIPIEMQTVSRINHQIDTITPLVTEELIRSAERQVDITYPMFKDDFQELGESITQYLSYCTMSGKKGIAEACLSLQMDYDSLCSEIEYIHKQGPGYEIEPTKRQIAYEDARARMQKLEVACAKLARYVSTL